MWDPRPLTTTVTASLRLTVVFGIDKVSQI